MSIRSKVMDKYWLKYLKDYSGDIGYSSGEGLASHFWQWFYRNIYEEEPQELGKYL